MNMNAPDDKEACGSKKGPEYLDNGNNSYTCPIYCNVSVNGNGSDISSNSKLCGTTGTIGSKNTLHNDCGKVCLESTSVNGSSSQNNILQYSLVYNGDHPKVRPNLVTCNIPGSSVERCDIQKMNNNVINGKVEDVNGMDAYMRNNVDYYPNVDKCPSKVRNENSRGTRHEDWDSSSENEGDEECYIYTYKGDCNQMADLPTSFFKLDVVPPRENNESRSSSPDMDYLEMDFDPGPSQDRDSSPSPESECCAVQQSRDVEDGSVTPVCEPEPLAGPSMSASEPVKDLDNQPIQEEHSEAVAEPEPPLDTAVPVADAKLSPGCGFNYSVPGRFCVNAPRDPWSHHSGSGNLCSPASLELYSDLWTENTDLLHFTPQENTAYAQKNNFHSTLYHCIMGKRLVLNKSTTQINDPNEDSIENGLEEGKPIERTMIWSEQEACAKQVTQISTSACGTTSCINALLSLNVSFSFEKLKSLVNTRLRKETSPLPEYLFSRSNAGASHTDIIRGLKGASHGILYARFFHMYPQRNVSLTRWLSYWMKKGAVAIATMNLQRGVEPDSIIPDAWHHQMVFGVGPRGLYLTNPLECVSEAVLWPQLCSPSVLKVRSADIITRWTPSTDLHHLIQHPDPRWKKLNVLGQVVNMIRESRSHQSRTVPGCRNQTSHVTIPVVYCSGITMVIRRESPGYQELRNVPDLPLMQQVSLI